MRVRWKTVARALVMGALVFCLRTDPVVADPMADAKAAYARQDFATAFPLFRELAKETDPEARFWLGTMYFLGYGTPSDAARGLALIHSAADAGLGGAQYTLGYIYENGFAVSADPVQALTWYKIGARNGHSEADIRGQAISPTMPEELVNQATERARAWTLVPLEDLPNP
jgi:uncharacterized protein